jgi:hypothetical protein
LIFLPQFEKDAGKCFCDERKRFAIGAKKEGAAHGFSHGIEGEGLKNRIQKV